MKVESIYLKVRLTGLPEDLTFAPVHDVPIFGNSLLVTVDKNPEIRFFIKSRPFSRAQFVDYWEKHKPKNVAKQLIEGSDPFWIRVTGEIVAEQYEDGETVTPTIPVKWFYFLRPTEVEFIEQPDTRL